MRRVKITLPATVLGLGPAVKGLGLALGMHLIVEVSERGDETLMVEPTGEGAGRYSVGARHPVVLGLSRVFQRLERAPLGLNVRIENRIPLDCGLGAETAFLVAGVVGANNLMGNPFARGDVLQIVLEMSGETERAVTTLSGGLTASGVYEGALHYRSLSVAVQRVVLVLPELDDYAQETEGVVADRVLLADALHNLSAIPMLLDALREGDHVLLAKVMSDRLTTPFYRPYIRGYERVIERLRKEGASAVTLSGTGPALVVFAESNHRALADAAQQAFQAAGITSRVWILPVDTQGVVVSVAQSAGR